MIMEQFETGGAVNLRPAPDVRCDMKLLNTFEPPPGFPIRHPANYAGQHDGTVMKTTQNCSSFRQTGTVMKSDERNAPDLRVVIER